MTIEEKIGPLMVIGLSGLELTKAEAQFIASNNIGGVILFDRNIQDPKQVHSLCMSVHALKEKMSLKIPPFIGIDMEGGRVARLKAPFTEWPPLNKLGEIDSTSIAFKFSNAMGSELNAVGINLDFAPCVDVISNPENKVIGDRSISDDPEMVSKIASAIVRGYVKSNILACAKHFPGHGNTFVDSHEDLPVEEFTLEELENSHLIPFKKSFRARLDMVMTAHIKFPKIDNEWPVTLSEKFLKNIIRDDYRYKNLVISDDLDMKALRNHYSREEIAPQALKAGCDMILYCNEPESPEIAIESIKNALSENRLSSGRIEESFSRVEKIKKAKLDKLVYPSYEEAIKVIGHPDHMKLSRAISTGDIPEDLLTT
ncbi:MAG: beta-N-acetylhexosaminidase [Bdellovibrionales bacterium]|nr:beta-N-acetylhexosaminidase [Bdellovibrionales bacterium]